MPRRPLRLRTAEADAEVRAGLHRIRAEFSVPGPFPPAVLAEAARPAALDGGRADLRDVPFFTLDPPGSMDLDQAMHLERLRKPKRAIVITPAGAPQGWELLKVWAR